MPQTISMCNVNLPHIIVRKNDKGGERWYFRRRGFPISRLPSPSAPHFRNAYAVKLAESNGINLADADRAQAGYRDYWAASMHKAAQKRANRICNLTRQDIVGMLRKQGDKCAVSGIRFHYRRAEEKQDPLSPSLDRINSELEYTVENCRVVLLAVNYGLNRWGDETFKRICRAVAKRRDCPLSPSANVHGG